MRRFTQAIHQTAQNLANDVRQAFRGVLHLVKSADNIQKVQASGLADETLQDVELMQHFGFTSVPPANTQAVILPIGGQTSHGIVIATENGSFRVKNLQGGEVAVYDESGSSIVLKKGRLIEIDCDVLKIKAASKVDISSPLVKTDQVFIAQGDVKAGSISLKSHKHPGDSGGKTGLPE